MDRHGRFQGQVANFAGHLPGESCYRCFVGDAFDAQDCDTCAADGVLGAMVGMVGSFAAMQAIRVGFRSGELASLEMVDSFGQRSSLRFSGFKANTALDASVFQFKPPPGADVIRQ